LEKTLHDLVTTFTRSLMLEQAQIPASLAAKLMQFASELHAFGHLPDAAPEPPQPLEPPRAPPGLADAIVEKLVSADQLTPVRLPQLTARGTVPVSPQEANAKRRAAWTPEKRRQARERAIARGLGGYVRKPLPEHTKLYP